MKESWKQGKRWVLALVKWLGLGVIIALSILLGAGIYILSQKPDLKVWHTARLEEEFSSRKKLKDFSEYLQLEERLFQELDEKVKAHVDEVDQHSFNRFHAGSISDPERGKRNWNRSFELKPAKPTGEGSAGGILLLHGLSDSPYSLRKLGETLQGQGYYVVGLRIPGHGTAPSGLTRVRWQDMAAAVELAMLHLQEKVGTAPVSVVGYSNGGALAVHYGVESLERKELPRVKKIVLISPEIGITPMAGLAIWQKRIGRLLGLQKLQWESVSPEYDPFKYSSFPVNAGDLAHRLTKVNRDKLARLSASGKLDSFPPILAFQSVVDATVSTPALVNDLFFQLPENRHELVMFGLNRSAKIEFLLSHDPEQKLPEVLEDSRRKFVFTVLTDENSPDGEVVERTWPVGAAKPATQATGLQWPAQTYSLTHVALPFAADDPVYGTGNPDQPEAVSLGNLAWRGERGVLRMTGNDMLRLRWNPFYSYQEKRILSFLTQE